MNLFYETGPWPINILDLCTTTNMYTYKEIIIPFPDFIIVITGNHNYLIFTDFQWPLIPCSYYEKHVQKQCLTSRGSPEPEPVLDWLMRSLRDSPEGMKASSCSRSLWYRLRPVCSLYLIKQPHKAYNHLQYDVTSQKPFTKGSVTYY